MLLLSTHGAGAKRLYTCIENLFFLKKQDYVAQLLAIVSLSGNLKGPSSFGCCLLRLFQV